MAFRSLTKLLRSRLAPSIPPPSSALPPPSSLPMRTIGSSSPSLQSYSHHYSSCRSSFSSSSASPSPPTCSKRAHSTATTATRQPPPPRSQTTTGDTTVVAVANQQQQQYQKIPTTTPDAPQFLGLAGVIPFAAGALATAVAPEAYVPVFATATQLYGASILSFLGGVHWGLALRHPPAVMTRDFVVSVIPSLIGWSAALAAPNPGLLVLSGSFMASYGYDRFRLAASRVSPHIPLWYLPMRLPLTVAAAGGCAVAWFTVYQCESNAKRDPEIESKGNKGDTL